MLTGADCSWPSAEELAKANQVRQNCLNEIRALSDPTRDVIGDVRLTRFLRFYNGDVPKATKGYQAFLTWRAKENIETLRKGVIELGPQDFMKWVESVRSPYGPPVCLELGESPEGHSIIFASPGFFKAVEFVKERPACHTMDTDLLLVWICVEWALKRLDDRSYRMSKILYSIKIIDLNQLGKERIPIFVPEVRNFAKTNVPSIMSMYCDHDILIMIVNTPFIFRIVWAFASNLMSKRQQARVKTFSDVKSKDAQELLKAVSQPNDLPPALGGTRSVVPLTFPLAYEDPQFIQDFKARKTPALVRGQVPACLFLENPALRQDHLTPSTRMSVDAQGRATVIESPSDQVAPCRDASADIAAAASSSVASTVMVAKSSNSLWATADQLERDPDVPPSNPASAPPVCELSGPAVATPEFDGVITPRSGWSCCGDAKG